MKESENVLCAQGGDWLHEDSFQLKIKYLIQEKKHTENQNAQLTRDLESLRQINQKLLENTPKSGDELLKILYKENSELQRKYQATIELNMRLDCQFLLLQQVMKENENEFRQINYSHEEKITFLRRQIQLKEGLLQLYEDKNKAEKFEEMTPVGFNQISLLFFAQIDEIRKKVVFKEQELKICQEQCKRLAEEFLKSEQKRNQLEALCKTQVSFAEMKLYYSNTVRTRSSFKSQILKTKGRQSRQSTAKHSQFPSEEQSANRSVFEGVSLISQTSKVDKYRPAKEPIPRDLAEAQAIFGINEQMKSINPSLEEKLRKVAILIQQKNSSIRIKNEKIASLKQKLQGSNVDRKRLMEAVAKMNTNREFLINEVQYYKSTNTDLLSYLTSRKPLKRSKTLQASQVERFLQSVRKPKKISQQFDKAKELFKAAHKKMTFGKMNLNPLRKKLRRSVSCSQDYMVMRDTKELGWSAKAIQDFSVFIGEENVESHNEIKEMHGIGSSKVDRNFRKKPVKQLDESINSSLFFEF